MAMSRRDWYVLFREGSLLLGIFTATSAAFYIYLRIQSWQVKATKDVHEAVRTVRDATLEVHNEIERLAHETARAQRLAVRVGVGTAVLGAILGGFAGAVAARLVGA